MSGHSHPRHRWSIYIVALSLMLGGVPAFGQSIFATLTGMVSDQSQAVVPNASVTLKKVGSGDVRRTVANSDGYYTFTGVPVGTYDLAVEAKGFVKYENTGIAVTGAEKRNVNVTLQSARPPRRWR